MPSPTIQLISTTEGDEELHPVARTAPRPATSTAATAPRPRGNGLLREVENFSTVAPGRLLFLRSVIPRLLFVSGVTHSPAATQPGDGRN